MPGRNRPLVLIGDDDKDVVRFLVRQLDSWGYRTAAAFHRKDLLEQFSKEPSDYVLLDLHFGEDDGIAVMKELLAVSPSTSVVLLTGHGTIATAVAAIRQGAYDFQTKPLDLPRLRLTLEHAVERHTLRRRIDRMKHLTESKDALDRLWGASPSLNRMRAVIESIAPTDVTVLIQGESGTGKELVARAVHDRSARKQGPFVPVNMAALPRELVESTLFGHEKGAFTGADQVRIGCCEAADNGTLFLDEIGEMDLDIQSKLLRFLQEREIQRVGSSKTKSVNVRIVAATNRDLKTQVSKGKFREDLFYRLQVVPLDVPPLRARKDDVPLLATRFLERAAAKHNRGVSGFSPEALECMSRYEWPGNIRQLENLVERLVVLCRGDEIEAEDLPEEVRGATDLPGLRPIAPGSKVLSFDQMEKRMVQDALRKTHGNVREAAKLLGLGQATVYRKIKLYGLTSPVVIAST